MAVRSNREILTGGNKYKQKQAKKFGVAEVVFDKDSRQDYLTGFHKRKVERQKKAQKFHEEQNRKFKIEERKQLREEKQREFETQLEQLKEARKLDIGALQDEDEEEEQDEEWNGFQEDSNKSDADSDADEPLKGILQRKEVYKIDNPEALGDAVVDDETTVTIEELENPYMANVGHSGLELLAQKNNVDLKRSDEVLEKSIKRAKNYAVVCGVSKPKPKKKKFRYLTKTERRENNRKAKAGKMKSKNRD